MLVWFLQSLIPLSAKYEYNMDKGRGMEILVLSEELAKALQEVPFVRDLERQGGYWSSSQKKNVLPSEEMNSIKRTPCVQDE